MDHAAYSARNAINGSTRDASVLGHVSDIDARLKTGIDAAYHHQC
jgi:hypothetical protein